jgi:hypothetical protein
MACKWLDICPLRELEKEGKLSMKWKEQYCQTKNKWKNCKRYQLEAQGVRHENLLPNGDYIKTTRKI